MLVTELARRGWQCQLFVLEADGPLKELLSKAEIVVIDGGYSSTSAPWIKVAQLGRALFRLWLLTIRTRPDVLHAYLPLTNFLGALAGRTAGVPVILTSRRGLGTHQDRNPGWRPFDRISNLCSHYVTVNSRAVADDTVARDGIRPEKLVIIHNGIDMARFHAAARARDSMRRTLGLEREALGVVVVGNLIPYKGHADLLRALPDVVSGGARVQLFFVGEDRGIGAGLRQLAEELRVAQFVTFLGRRDDVAQILAGMDLCAVASHEEGFSNALLEAMASGLAIVATDVGGNPEALQRGELGILVPPRDPVALAAALRRLVENEDERLELGRRAREVVASKYTVDAMVDGYIALYRRGTKTLAAR